MAIFYFWYTGFNLLRLHENLIWSGLDWLKNFNIEIVNREKGKKDNT